MNYNKFMLHSCLANELKHDRKKTEKSTVHFKESCQSIVNKFSLQIMIINLNRTNQRLFLMLMGLNIKITFCIPT